MNTAISPELTVEPILQYPRLAAVGTAFLLTVDLKPQQFGESWAYPELEEVPIRCIINSGTLFRVELLGEPVVIVHRYGGTYSPARFLLTPEPNSIGKSSKVRITLANRFGVPMTVLETEEIAVQAEASVESLIAITRRKSRQPIKLLSFEFDIAEIIFIELEDFEFQQANIELRLFRSKGYANQGSETPENPETLQLFDLKYIRSNCFSVMESLQTNQAKTQFAKAMWMSTDFGTDGIRPENICNLAQIMRESSLLIDNLKTMGIALNKQRALQYLQELNQGFRDPQMERITDRALHNDFQRLFNHVPSTSGGGLLCTYVEWFYLWANLNTVVGKENRPKAIILPDELTKWIPDDWEPEFCSKPNWIVYLQYAKAHNQKYTETLADDLMLDMVLIPSGSFTMGASKDEEGSEDNERPQHEVSIGTFFIGKYPITQAQYKAVMGNNPSRFKDEPDSPNHPVERVSWDDATEFCRRLSEQTGEDYRLPSEAEWEYACRAGTTTPFHFGETIDAEIVNYDASIVYGQGKEGIYRQKTTPVGSFKVANAFGLYDMHGNVWEWCADTWHDNYEGAPKDGSAWVELNKTSHSLRGGSWGSFPRLCRSAFRDDLIADDRSFSIGFRVACSARGLL